MDNSVRARGIHVFGPFRLDAARRMLSRAGEAVVLTPTLFDTLLYLVENPGRVVSKSELMDAIWPGRIVEESNVSQTIFMLRKALGEGGDAERFILTAPGQGYRFAADVRLEVGGRLLAPTARGQLASGAASAGWLRRPLPIAAGVAGLVLLAVAVAIATRPWAIPRAPGARSMVVLSEFQNLTGEPVFDRSLGKALEIGLDQSPFVSVAPERQVQDTLVLMTRPKDTRLTRPLAEEVCARDAGDAVLDGSIAALGAKYLLTLTATDCSGERLLAAEKVQADSREAVIPALDGLIRKVRGKLGEPAGSIEAFGVPLLRERTASLAALKAYSEGAWLDDHGRRADAIPLFQHAIEIDPNFAAAYAALSSVYYSMNQDKLDVANITRAYALRDTVSEREKFHIVARYHESVTRDANEALRNFQVWSETYPQDPAAWMGLSNAENWIGRFPAAVEAGQRALALSPASENAYVVLARAWLHAGQPDQALAICNRAIAAHLDGDATHGQLLRIAISRGDKAAVEREMNWARGKPAEHGMLLVAAMDAYRHGQVARGEELFTQVAGRAQAAGLTDITLAPRARWLTDLGLTGRARVLMSRIPAGFDSADYRFTMAEIGDAARAEAILRDDRAKSPSDTLLNDVYTPEVDAAVALRRGQGAAAAASLAPAIPYETRDYDVIYLRGIAWLAASDGPRAASEFEKILAHPGVDAVSPLYPLARLGLARAYRMERDLPASRRQYQAFLSDWKDADPNLPILQAAKAEYAKL